MDVAHRDFHRDGQGGGIAHARGSHPAVAGLGFSLTGDRDLARSRAKVAEGSRQALADIGTTVAGVSLPRTPVVEAVNAVLDGSRFVQIRGRGGVGKSSVLLTVARRVATDAHILVLDPINTPEGGWSALAAQLNISVTAREFLADLAASGGGTLFIDSLEMFVSPGKRRTVNDLLREIATTVGFSVVATAREEFGTDGDDWLAADAVASLGEPGIVAVPELQEDEVEILRRQAPELDALLAPDHPASGLARNLYRLSRLFKTSAAASIRTEAALADSWWRSGDDIAAEHLRAAQRLMADLADAVISGGDTIEAREDSYARSHLLRAKTLTEGRRDRLGFYHDALRDWAVGARLAEDPDLVTKFDLTAPASSRVARGVEFAGRFALEASSDCSKWPTLIQSLSPVGAHGSWRRNARLAILRSEVSLELLERCTAALLDDDGILLSELITAVIAVETTSPADVVKDVPSDQLKGVSIPKSLRLATTRSAARLLK